MKSSLRIGTVAGIGLFIHWTFILLIAFVIYTNRKAGNDTEQTLWSLLFVLSIFATVLLHELGHALTAKRYKIRTKDITLLPIGGMARLESIPEKPSEEFMVAIAGPMVNIALAAITALFIAIPSENELLAQLEAGVNQSNFFLNFFIVNIVLAIFNLIPAFPMDGGRVLRALLATQLKRTIATNIAATIGQIIAILFVIAGFYGTPTLIFIGIFIFIGARSEASMTQMHSVLNGYTVRDIVMHNYQTIASHQTIGEAVELLLNGQVKEFVVTENSLPFGSLSRDEIIKALSEQGESTVISTIINKQLDFLSISTPLEIALKKMQSRKHKLIPIVENNKFVGVIDNENILEFILIKEAERTE